MTQIPLSAAIKALQHLYRAFTGRELPEDNARRLLEQTKNEME